MDMNTNTPEIRLEDLERMARKKKVSREPESISLSLPPASQDVVDAEDTRELLKIAENYFEQGQLQRSESILQQLLLRDTKEPRVFYLLGAIYYDFGKHHRAEVAFKRCLDLNPDYRDASLALTILYNDLGDYEKAEAIYQRARSGLEQTAAVGRDPHIQQHLAEKHEELGDLYSEHEYFKEAHHEYTKAATLQPQDVNVAIKAAKALEKSGSKSASIEQLKDLKSAFPESIPVRLALGMCYYNAQRLPEAVAEWEAVLRREPNQNEAKLYLKVASQTETTTL